MIPCCRECGYDLRGAVGPCPECGVEPDSTNPWTPAPWPGAARLALRLCGPCAVVAGVFIGLSFYREVRAYSVWPLWLPWLVVLLASGIVWPLGAARALATDRLPRRHRAIGRTVGLVAVVVNTAVLFVAIGAFLAML